MGMLVDYAKDELDLIGMTEDSGEENKAMRKSILEFIELMSNQ